jgi:RNA polymerase sigma factor (sigma-70 family)
LAQSRIHISGGNSADNLGAAGNVPDIESVFLRYSHLIYLACNKYLRNAEESKDAVMEIFLKFLANGKSYKVVNLPAWLQTVAKNHCLMKIRKANKTKVFYYPPDKIDSFDMENEGLVHHVEERPIQWNELLGKLSEEQRRCVEMFYFQKKSYKEIAGLNAMGINEVKSYLQNGKRNLKILLKKMEGENA